MNVHVIANSVCVFANSESTIANPGCTLANNSKCTIANSECILASIVFINSCIEYSNSIVNGWKIILKFKFCALFLVKMKFGFNFCRIINNFFLCKPSNYCYKFFKIEYSSKKKCVKRLPFWLEYTISANQKTFTIIITKV